MADIAVIDLETTGLGKHDRVVEVGVVRLDGSTFETLYEFESLVYPERDVGPTRIHGITATMVSAAPKFRDLLPSLSAVLDGAVLAAHNLPFDRRFLGAEFERAGIVVQLGEGLCTLNLTHANLDDACREFAIERQDAHRALTDARACGALLRALSRSERLDGAPVVFPEISASGVPHTLHRDQVGGSRLEGRRRNRPLRFPAAEEAPLTYLHLLDVYLADAELSDEEMADLRGFAASMSLHDVDALHVRYLGAVRLAVEQDGRVSRAEFEYLRQLHSLLGVDFPTDFSLPESDAAADVTLIPGLRVCFTGEAMAVGRYWSRDELIGLASKRGLVPVESVTRKGCDLLVAADLSTASGKAGKARGYGIPILAVDDFVRRLVG